MPNAQLPLTENICRSAMPENREYSLRDLKQPGLTFRVQPSGAQTWIVRLSADGKQEKRTIGHYPAMTVKAARNAARAVLARGATVRQRSGRSSLFSMFQAEHEARHARTFKPSGLTTYRTYVATQLIPAFGAMRLEDITRQSVFRWFEDYSQSSPGGANRALGILGQMLGCAQMWGHFDQGWSNPTSGIRRNRSRIVGRFLSDAQMARLGRAVAKREAAGCPVASVIHFLLLTRCRVGEALSLHLQDIHPGHLRLRDSKTGPREVVLGSAARKFLARYQSQSKSFAGPYRGPEVFRIANPKRYEEVRSQWKRIRREAKLPSTLRLHDLRHSFASHAIMGGETLFTTSRLLGHSRIQTTARYAHLSDDSLMAAAEKVGQLLMAQLPD